MLEELQVILDECIAFGMLMWRDITKSFDKKIEHFERWQIAFFSVGITIVFYQLWGFLFKPKQSIIQRIKITFFAFVKNLPIVRGKIQKVLDKQYKDLEEMFQKTNKGMPYLEKLPEKGLSEEEVKNMLEKYQSLVHIKWNEGACSGSVYSGEEKLTKLITSVYENFAWSNPLHADVFCDVRKMETEVVKMTCDLFQGGPETCGVMTTGGTESLLLACYAYRNLAHSKGIEHPEIVLPITAHPAFDKAAHMFNIKLMHVPVDEKTLKANMALFRKAISGNTCMLVGSAPQFPHGVIDPISEIAKLGVKYRIPVHVDCCLGGFLVPFMKRAGFDIDTVDFSINGVTSISADTHKYGLAPKGSSVLMYSDKKFRRHQYFVTLNWPGGIYASPSILGSRAGSLIAACWATMVYTGLDGYVDSTRKIITTIRYLHRQINKIDGIFALEPETSMLVIGSKEFNVYRLSDELSHKGWCLSPLQYPTFIHMGITQVHTKEGVADRFIQDVTTCAAKILKDKGAKVSGTAAIYGMAQSIPDTSLVAEVTGSYFDAYYSTKMSA